MGKRVSKICQDSRHQQWGLTCCISSQPRLILTHWYCHSATVFLPPRARCGGVDRSHLTYEANALYLSAAVVAKEDSCSIWICLSIRPAPQLHLSMQAAPTYMYLPPVFDMKKATWSVPTVHVARENSQKPLVSFWRKQNCTGLTGDCSRL